MQYTINWNPMQYYLIFNIIFFINFSEFYIVFHSTSQKKPSETDFTLFQKAFVMSVILPGR